MGLIKCPDCKKDMSDAANSCPSCGRPRTKTYLEKQAEEQAHREEYMRKTACQSCGSHNIGTIPIGLTFFGMRTKKCFRCGKTW